MSTTTTGVFKLTLDESAASTVVDGGCRYALSIRDLDAAIYIREGIVASAGINARLVQRAETPCTAGETSRPLSHAFSRVTADAAQVTIEFVSERIETVDVGLTIVVPAGASDTAPHATLTWSARAPATWTIRAGATFEVR